MSYLNYRDPRWQRRSAEIRARDDYECTGCFRKDALLQVHHIVYIADREAWEYPDNLLQTLCEGCHEERHEILRRACDALKVACSKVPTRRLPEVAQRLIEEAIAEVYQ